MQKNTVLGLDLGTTSVGWCLLDMDAKKIVDLGVRIYPEGVNRTKGEKSLNQNRRDARSLRRQTYRRNRRHDKLRHILQAEGLLPKNETELQAFFSESNPYELRSKGLDEKLEPFEIGRALYHLGQRRGYLSNRKTGEEKDGKVAEGITQIQQGMEACNARTLGEYFYKQSQQGQKIRGVYTQRAMFKDEFSQLWASQQAFSPKLLTAPIKKLIFDAIFHQRPLKIQKHLIGYCELEPERRRCQAATLAAQEFRLWQTINHLKILFSNGTERWLTDEERQVLYDLLKAVSTKSWAAIRKQLNKSCNSNILEHDRFNLEKVRKSGLQGNKTAAIVSKAVGPKPWKALGAKGQEQLVFDLLNLNSDEALLRRLRKHWGLPEAAVQALLTESIKLPKGVLHVSHKAARAITQELSNTSTENNRGLTYDKACLNAGYKHTQLMKKGTLNALPLPNPLTNKMTERALYQVRRVVNAVIKEHGLPKTIRIEMARDLKNNAKKRADIDKINKYNQSLNDKARAFFESNKLGEPSRNDIIKHRLWEECKYIDPFTGDKIAWFQLFGEQCEYEVEHIIPYSRCADDSFMNKTLCRTDINALKGNQTPYEAFGQDEAKYSDILQRAKKLPYRKFKRFSEKAMDMVGDFVSQQLNETRYIAVQSRDFLAQLNCDVQGIKGGRVTSQLRHAWGLNNLLNDKNIKTRDDHRHHAIDAFVVALTSRSMVQKITQHVNQERALHYGEVVIKDLACPINEPRTALKNVLQEVIVSHKTNHKVSGPLHDETIYGITDEPDKNGRLFAVVRKPIASFTNAKQLDAIRDDAIRELAKTHLAASSNAKDAFNNPNNPLLLPNKKGAPVPIKSVRVRVSRSVRPLGKAHRDTKKLGNDGQKYKHVWTRGNHHAELFEYTAGNGLKKWDAAIVPLIDAAERLRKGQPVVCENHGDNTAFVMALHINDMVELTHKGQRVVCRVQKMDVNKNIVFRLHTDALKDEKTQISLVPSSLKNAKPMLLNINVLGKVKHE